MAHNLNAAELTPALNILREGIKSRARGPTLEPSHPQVWTTGIGLHNESHRGDAKLSITYILGLVRYPKTLSVLFNSPQDVKHPGNQFSVVIPVRLLHP